MHLTRRHALLLTTAQVAVGLTVRTAVADDGVGSLESLANEVWGTQVGAARVALAEAAQVFRNQRLETGDDSAAEVRFIDASKLSLGANANVVVDDYVFAGDASRSAITMTKGAFRFISGAIRDFIHKSRDEAIERGINELKSKSPIPIPFDIPNPFK
jgi:hypothetical protein